MNDEIEAMGAEKSFHADAVADVQIVVSKVQRDPAQAIQIPSCVARIAEENPAHVVVHAVAFAALAVKVFDRF